MDPEPNLVQKSTIPAGIDHFAVLGLKPDDVFVWFPPNVDYLKGMSSKPRFRPIYEIWIVLVILIAFQIGVLGETYEPGGWAIEPCLFLVLVLFAVLAFREWRFRRRREDDVNTATLIIGQVVSCFRGSAWERKRLEVTLIYEYWWPSDGDRTVAVDKTGWRNYPEKEILPKPGTPVVVIVYKDPIQQSKPFRRPARGFVL